MPTPPADDHPDKVERARRLESFKIAVATRQFEIDLVWKRSTFFFGFIAAAFIAYANFTGKKTGDETGAVVPLLISAFGLVCAVAWSLANRGSKFWQENWEIKVRKLERDAVQDRLFRGRDVAERGKENPWLLPRQFSVSKLTIALSDFTAVLWCVLMAIAVANAPLAFAVLTPTMTALFLFYMGLCAQTGADRGEGDASP